MVSRDTEAMYQRACAGYEVILRDHHPTTVACLQDSSSMHQEANSTGLRKYILRCEIPDMAGGIFGANYLVGFRPFYF